MFVINNLLYLDQNTQVAFAESNNSEPGLHARYIIMHYTAGSSVRAAIDTLRNDQVTNRVSAHLVISRTGEITQLVPFDQVAWHAGISYWENERDLNPISIGIELDNEGWYREKEKGIWISSFKTPGLAEDLDELIHPKQEGSLGWRKYPPVQRQAALEACRALRAAYPDIVEVLGHEDIHQDKTDPGPAFRLDEFRAALFPERTPTQGQVTTLQASVKVYQTIRAAPIYENECRDKDKVIDRYGPPPVLPARHPASPLPEATKVKVIRNQKDQENNVKWSLVEVKSKLPGFKNVVGWVNAELVKANQIKSPAVLYTDTSWMPKPETPRHQAETLRAGIRIRRLETKKPWVLVCTLDKITSHGIVYAWLRESDIQQK